MGEKTLIDTPAYGKNLNTPAYVLLKSIAYKYFEELFKLKENLV